MVRKSMVAAGPPARHVGAAAGYGAPRRLLARTRPVFTLVNAADARGARREHAPVMRQARP
jgi:hypothetical protein